MHRFSSLRQDLSLQMLALYLLFVGPVIVGALFFNMLAGKRLRAEAQAGDLGLANVIAQEINTYLGGILEITDQLASHSAIINAEPARMEELFRTLTIGRSDISQIYLIDANCGIRYYYQPGIGPGRFGPGIQELGFECPQQPTEPFIAQGHRSPLSRQLVATVASPIRSLRDERYIGLVAIDVRLNALNDLAKLSVQHRPQERFLVYFVDHQSQIVTRSDFDPAGLLIDLKSVMPGEIAAALRDKREGSLIAAEMLYSYVPIGETGWGVVVSRPTTLAFTTPQDFNRGVLVALSFFSVIGLFFWIMLSRRMIRPLERLAAYSQRIGREKLPPAGRDAEVTSLAHRPDQLGHLVRSLMRAEEQIAARLNELSTLLETSASVVSTLDLQTVLDRILEQVERLLGIEKCAIVALDERRGVFRSQASRGLSRSYTEQIIIHPGEPVSITMRAIQTGKPVQVSDVEGKDTSAALRYRARQEGIRSILAVPLTTQHAPQAALLVYRPDAHVFTSQEINLLATFANQAAMAFENATLYARSDMRLQEQTRRLEALVQSMEDGLILEDLDGNVLYANRTVAELTSFSRREVVGAPVEKLMARILRLARQPEKTSAAIHKALNHEGSRRVDIELVEPTGRRYLRLRIFDVTDSNGTPIGRGRILQDVTRRRELDRMKSSLISTVSHELRTPLAAIKGYASTLLAEDVEWDPVSQREFLTIISNETDRLTELVKDLLDMSRIEAGNLSISRLEADLGEMIEHAAQRAYSQPGDRLRVSIAANVPPLFVDRQRIEVVLRNLIENAAKYSGEHTPIWISAVRQGNEVIVRVEDQGVGIPEEHSQHIFESFYRIENGLDRTTSGAGLGLAICQGFVRAHGGRIWLEKRAQGTCIAFSLPLIEEAVSCT